MLFKFLLECSHRQVGHHLPLLLWPMGKTWPLLLAAACGLGHCAWSVAVLFPACLRLLPLVYLQGGHPGVSSTCLCSFLLHLSVCACAVPYLTPPNSNYLACFETALVFAPQWFLYTSVAHIDARHEWRHQRTSTLIYVGGCRSRAMTGFDACCLG